MAADTAYQNARKNSDKANARIEHDKALGRVMLAIMKDDSQLFKQFSDNESFKKWLTDTVFGLTYEEDVSPCDTVLGVPRSYCVSILSFRILYVHRETNAWRHSR